MQRRRREFGPSRTRPQPGSRGPAPTARLPRRARPRPVTSWWPGASGMLGRAATAPAATAQAPPPPRHPPPDRDSARRVGTGRLAPRGARGRRRFRAPGGRRGLWNSAGRAQGSAANPPPGDPRETDPGFVLRVTAPTTVHPLRSLQTHGHR
nr:serine/arginine-rich splicing factor SR45-like [Globicephala melas]